MAAPIDYCGGKGLLKSKFLTYRLLFLIVKQDASASLLLMLAAAVEDHEGREAQKFSRMTMFSYNFASILLIIIYPFMNYL